jgi:hypothetical protein
MRLFPVLLAILISAAAVLAGDNASVVAQKIWEYQNRSLTYTDNVTSASVNTTEVAHILNTQKLPDDWLGKNWQMMALGLSGVGLLGFAWLKRRG